MAGLDPAIHVFLRKPKNVDARDKPGHDEFLCGGLRLIDCRRQPAAPVSSRIGPNSSQRSPLNFII
jgi:hypothetical protein